MKRKKIVFLGSDGSGKTTLLNFTKSKAEERGKTTEVFILGWKRFQNPVLKVLSKIHLKNKEKKKYKYFLKRINGWK